MILPPPFQRTADMSAGGAGGRFRPWLGIGGSQPADGAQLRLRGAVDEVDEDIEAGGEAEKDVANGGARALDGGSSSWESTSPPVPTAPPLGFMGHGLGVTDYGSWVRGRG